MVGRAPGGVDHGELAPIRQWVFTGEPGDRVLGGQPAAQQIEPVGPVAELASACVAMAPTSAPPHGTAKPTARHFDATATPHEREAGSKATIENVIGSPPRTSVH